MFCEMLGKKKNKVIPIALLKKKNTLFSAFHKASFQAAH